MSLVVAGVAGQSIWMVSDTAITGGNISLRERVFRPKIEISSDGLALAGSAGDDFHGRRLVKEACSRPAGVAAIEGLLHGHLQYPSVDFLYGYQDISGPHLVRVSDGTAHCVTTAHIGLTSAFETFQRIRYETETDYVPLALKTLMCAVRGSEVVPKELTVSIASMLGLFAERIDHDVGGWAVPYLLSPQGALFCSYGYSVSDPILDKVTPGSLVPHGTAEAGGFGLSVTELGKGEGMVVYWLQKPGGVVFVTGPESFEAHEFDGPPSVFKANASAALDRAIDLWFGDRPPGIPRKINVLRDKAGNPSVAIADHGDSFTLAVHNVVNPFHSEATLSMSDAANVTADQPPTTRVDVSLSADNRVVTISLSDKGLATNQLCLQPAQLDQLIEQLGKLRSSVSEDIPTEPLTNSGASEAVVIDPMWRTQISLHPALDGIMLRLRHLGFGWVAFLLPHNEALSLGTWLRDHSKVRQSVPETSETKI